MRVLSLVAITLILTLGFVAVFGLFSPASAQSTDLPQDCRNADHTAHGELSKPCSIHYPFAVDPRIFLFSVSWNDVQGNEHSNSARAVGYYGGLSLHTPSNGPNPNVRFGEVFRWPWESKVSIKFYPKVLA